MPHGAHEEYRVNGTRKSPKLFVAARAQWSPASQTSFRSVSLRPQSDRVGDLLTSWCPEFPRTPVCASG